MNNVVDEVLASNPRYNIKDSGGTTLYNNVQIDLATEVITEGTPLNKALFDSIKDDLNSRLLISSKANENQAKAGNNDTVYMTPLRVQQKLNYMSALKGKSTTYAGTGTGSGATSNTYSVFGSGLIYPDYQTYGGVITIWCNISLRHESGSAGEVTFLTINGSGFNGQDAVNSSRTSYNDSASKFDFTTISGSSLTFSVNEGRLAGGTSRTYCPAKITINYGCKLCEVKLYTQSLYTSGALGQYNNILHQCMFSFSELTDVKVTLKGSNSQAVVNVTYSR